MRSQLLYILHPLTLSPDIAKLAPNFKHADFDPSASYVHPLDRIKIKIAPSRTQTASTDISSALNSDAMDYQGEEEEEDEDDAGEDSDTYAESSSNKRVTRQSKLPFSPRKSRSQRIIVIDDSESERASSARPARRLTRGAVKLQLASDYSESEGGDDNDSEYAVSRSLRGPAKKKAFRPKFPPPSYGNIRPIAALEYDDYPEDKDNASLRAHRNICEKCHLTTAKELLQTMKKSKKGKKRKRGSEDEFDYSDDEDRYKELGGWVRWYVHSMMHSSNLLNCGSLKCPVSTHWSCLAGTQRDEILKAARAKARSDWEAEGKDLNDLPRRKFLDVEETTEFICGKFHAFW